MEVVRGAATVVQEHVGQSVTCRTESSGFDRIVQIGILQLSQESVAYVRVRNTYCEALSKSLGYNSETNSLRSVQSMDHGGSCRSHLKELISCYA